MTYEALVGDLAAEDPRTITVAVELLGQSVSAVAKGLVPYHAAGYDRFIAAALAPAPALRTLLIRAAVVSGEVVAVADWRILESELFLNGLAVRDELRGRGLGQRLLRDGVSMANELGVGALGLDVACDNVPALSLYRRNGFTDAGVASWVDATDDCVDRPDDAVRVVNWPAFQAQRMAYGFADLAVRDRVGKVTTVRSIGDALRIGWQSGLDLPAPRLRELLGATRVYAVFPPGISAPRQPFARFLRMRRDLTGAV